MNYSRTLNVKYLLAIEVYVNKPLKRALTSLCVVLNGFLVFVLLCSSSAFSLDLVKANIGESTLDQRIHFKRLVLTQALELTKEEYGAYDIEVHNYYMNAKRGFVELAAGEVINVYFALTQQKWEDVAIPVRIPVRRGLISYRLLLINKSNESKFEKIKSVRELKKMYAGLNDGWSTHTVMLNQSFNIFPVNDYDGMFSMLSVDRFDYIPRGVNEIFGEVDQRADFAANLLVANDIALYIPSATYIFVSKRIPRLAKRLEAGLTMMSENGDLKDIFYSFYGKSLIRANLKNRKILQIENPFLPKETPLKNKALWFDPTELDSFGASFKKPKQIIKSRSQSNKLQ